MDYSIKPEAVVPAVDTSTWPLLLKNYDKREFDLGSMDRNIRVYVYELRADCFIEQFSFALDTSPQSRTAARHSREISSHMLALVSSTLTSPPTHLPTKLSHG